MLKKIKIIGVCLILILLSSCKNGDDDIVIVKPVPIELPSDNTVGVVAYEEGLLDGYTLFAIHKSTYLIDNCGRVVNKWTSSSVSSHSVYLLEDGSLLRTGRVENDDFMYAGIGGVVERISWDNQLLWSYQISTPNSSQHHDAFPMPNGNVMVLVAERKSNMEMLQAGRDQSLMLGDDMFTEKLIEIQPSGANEGTIVWEWDAWDHLVQDFDNTKDNFGVVSDNPSKVNINYIEESINNSSDWLHTNSIDYNEDRDEILLSLNGISEYWVIDHSTTTQEATTSLGGNSGKGGDILYRWGNPAVYDSGDDSNQKLFQQHYPNWIPDGYKDAGKILVFNNRKIPGLDFSSVDLIDFPTGSYTLNGNGRYSPEAVDWTYRDPVDVENFYSHILSSAQRLKNGNTLVCEGTSGHFFELDENNEIVWEYYNPVNTQGVITEQGDAPASNNVFRAFKYPKDYAAFSGRNIIPRDPIELNFNIGNCE